MAETTTTEKPKLPPLIASDFSITKNEVSANFVDLIKEKGKQAGQHFVSLDPKTPIETLVPFLGQNTVFAVLMKDARRMCQYFTDECTTVKNGVYSFNADKFTKAIQAWEVSVESLAKLKDKLLELSNKLVLIDMNNPEQMTKLPSIIAEMQEVTAILNQRKKAAQEDDEETTPEVVAPVETPPATGTN